MPWCDLQALFALQFADDIANFTAGETETVMRQRLSTVGEHGRSLLREALDEVD
jgi:hypothetical protein